MNYQKIHDDLVKQCREQVLPKAVYTEKHHIIPRSLGGGEGGNIVTVTARQHFMLHALLYFIAKRSGTPEDKEKMAHAWNLMRSSPSKTSERYINSRLFETAKKDLSKRMSKLQSGEKNSQYGTKWITNGLKNKKLKRDEEMPEGWWEGRYTNGSRYDPEVPYKHERFNCIQCNAEFFRKTEKAKNRRKKKCDPCVKLQTTPLLILKKYELIELIEGGFSPHQACKEIGIRYNTAMKNYGMSGDIVQQVRQILKEEDKLHLLAD